MSTSMPYLAFSSPELFSSEHISGFSVVDAENDYLREGKNKTAMLAIDSKSIFLLKKKSRLLSIVRFLTVPY